MEIKMLGTNTAKGKNDKFDDVPMKTWENTEQDIQELWGR